MNQSFRQVAFFGAIIGLGVGAFLVFGLKKVEEQPRQEVDLVSAYTPPAVIKVDDILRGISVYESSDTDHKVGAAGERGRYQMMEGTWYDRTDTPFSEAVNPQVSYQVATDHIDWIYNTLQRDMGRAPLLDDILATYNGGIGAYRNAGFDVRRMTKSTQTYVEYVTNIIYDDMNL